MTTTVIRTDLVPIHNMGRSVEELFELFNDKRIRTAMEGNVLFGEFNFKATTLIDATTIHLDKAVYRIRDFVVKDNIPHIAIEWLETPMTKLLISQNLIENRMLAFVPRVLRDAADPEKPKLLITVDCKLRGSVELLEDT